MKSPPAGMLDRPLSVIKAQARYPRNVRPMFTVGRYGHVHNGARALQ
jgi:hypothetical protein